MNGTKKAIAESLKRLLARKSISKITISEITDGCGISRMTFYYHFRDIYDLMEWICEEDAREVVCRGEHMDNWEKGFCSLLESARENKSFILSVYRSVDRTQIENYFLRATEKLFLQAIEEQAAGMRIDDEAKRYVSSFFIHGIIGIIMEWVEKGMREEPRMVVDMTSQIIRGNFQFALERLNDPEPIG